MSSPFVFYLTAPNVSPLFGTRAPELEKTASQSWFNPMCCILSTMVSISDVVRGWTASQGEAQQSEHLMAGR